MATPRYMVGWGSRPPRRRPAVTLPVATRRLRVDRMRGRAADVRTIALLRESAAEVQAAAIEAEHTHKLHAQHSILPASSVSTLAVMFDRYAGYATHEQAAAAFKAAAEILRAHLFGIPSGVLPPEPTGWGAGREWALRSTPTASCRGGVETQGSPLPESEARARAERFNAEKDDDWLFRPVYRDTTPWTVASEQDAPEPARPICGGCELPETNCACG